MPGLLAAGFLQRFATDPVGTIVKTGRTLFGLTLGVIGLAWYNGWRNKLQGLNKGEIPIPGLSKLQATGKPDRADPQLPSPVVPTTDDYNRNSTLTAGTPLPDYSTLGPTTKAPDGGDLLSYDGQPVAAWIVPILKWARAHGWRGSVRSGYRSVAAQRRIYNSGVRPAAPPGKSNHNFAKFPGGAVDVSEAQQLAIVLSRSPYRTVLIWAGSKDPVHFSHPHDGGY